MCLCGFERLNFRNGTAKSSINTGRYTVDYLLCGDLPYPAWKKRVSAQDLRNRRIRRYFVCRLKRSEARDFSHVRFTAYQELLNKAYSLVDEIQIGRIMGYLNKADRVLVCGLGSSGLSAREMEIRFMRIGVNVDSLLDPDMMRMSSVFQNKNSLVIGFSLSGEREEVLYLLRESNRKGAKTILFTENNKSEFDEYCSEVVLLPSLKHLNHGNVISPQFPILVMLDIIYGYYVEQNKYIREGMHDSTLRALEEGEKRRKELY